MDYQLARPLIFQEGGVQKNMSSTPPVCIFSGIAHFLLLSY